MSKFERDWDKIIVDVEKAAVKAVTAATTQIYKYLIDATPVGKPEDWKNPPPVSYSPGNLRESWEISFNDGSTFSKPQGKGNYEVKLDVGQGAIAYQPGKDIIMRNQAGYALRLLDQGYSNQAPTGVVRREFAKFSRELDKAVKKYKL